MKLSEVASHLFSNLGSDTYSLIQVVLVLPSGSTRALEAVWADRWKSPPVSGQHIKCSRRQRPWACLRLHTHTEKTSRKSIHKTAISFNLILIRRDKKFILERVEVPAALIGDLGDTLVLIPVFGSGKTCSDGRSHIGSARSSKGFDNHSWRSIHKKTNVEYSILCF